MKKTFFIFLLGGFLSSCSAMMGEELARMPVNKITVTEDEVFAKEATLDLKKGQEIAFWSEIDLESEGDLALEFRVQVWKDNEQIELLNVYPFQGNITMNESKVEFGGQLNWSFSKKNATWKCPDTGSYKFSAILVSNGNEKLKLNKAELVIRK